MTLQTEYTADELLASHDYAEPLFAGGRPLPRRVRRRRHVRLAPHEGPRARHRGVAAAAPRAVRHRAARPAARHVARAVPERRPVAATSSSRASPEPIIATLTRIGTVEGFGSVIRNSVVPDLQTSVRRGDRTARRWRTSQRGLYEAHARDEAGHERRGRPQARCGSRHATSRSRTPSPRTRRRRMLERMGVAGPARRRSPTSPRSAPRPWPTACCPTTSTSTSSRSSSA